METIDESRMLESEHFCKLLTASLPGELKQQRILRSPSGHCSSADCLAASSDDFDGPRGIDTVTTAATGD